MIYKIDLTNGDEIELHNPADLPDPVQIDTIAEPWIKATIFTPDEYLGAVIKLCQDRRGEQRELSYVGSRAMVVYDLPLNEVVFDFYDRLKSISKGYASFDYSIEDYRAGRPGEDERSWSTPSRSTRSPCWSTATAPRRAAAAWSRR